MKSPIAQFTEAETGRVIVPKLEIARTLWAQTVGLMGRPSLPADTGLLIPRCNSIHTGFVRFPLDIVFLDSDCRVVRIVTSLAPWRIAGPVRGAKSVLELSEGTLRQKQVAVGQRYRVSYPDQIARTAD